MKVIHILVCTSTYVVTPFRAAPSA